MVRHAVAPYPVACKYPGILAFAIEKMERVGYKHGWQWQVLLVHTNGHLLDLEFLV